MVVRMVTMPETLARELLVLLEPRVHLTVVGGNMAKVHQKLSALGVTHTVTAKEPPDEAMGRPQLTLT
jgi:hypothetical protein